MFDAKMDEKGGKWHIEVDFDDEFVSEALSGWGDVPEHEKKETIESWFGVRIQDCAEDIAWQYEQHFDDR